MSGIKGYMIAFGVVGALMAWGAVKVARGIRNNNPLNIERTGDRWKGMSETQTDSRFVVFDSPVYGIRAGARILQSYQRRGVETIAGIVSNWAPPIENNTESYIATVEQKTGINRNQTVGVADYPAIIAAMIHVENGRQPYSMDLIQEGVSLA
jgi:hypothetical protein